MQKSSVPRRRVTIWPCELLDVQIFARPRLPTASILLPAWSFRFTAIPLRPSPCNLIRLFRRVSVPFPFTCDLPFFPPEAVFPPPPAKRLSVWKRPPSLLIVRKRYRHVFGHPPVFNVLDWPGSPRRLLHRPFHPEVSIVVLSQSLTRFASRLALEHAHGHFSLAVKALELPGGFFAYFLSPPYEPTAILLMEPLLARTLFGPRFFQPFRKIFFSPFQRSLCVLTSFICSRRTQ